MKKVLIVEDDQAIIEIVQIILEGEGYTTFIAQQEEIIFQHIAEQAPHLILLDIRLNGHDGGKIARHLKDNKETSNIPIIMMSANNETEKISKASGADDFLLKPFNIDELLAIVRKYTS